MLLNVQIVGLIHFVLRNIEVRHGDRRAAVVQHLGYCLDGYTAFPQRTPATLAGAVCPDVFIRHHLPSLTECPTG